MSKLPSSRECLDSARPDSRTSSVRPLPRGVCGLSAGSAGKLAYRNRLLCGCLAAMLGHACAGDTGFDMPPSATAPLPPLAVTAGAPAPSSPGVVSGKPGSGAAGTAATAPGLGAAGAGVPGASGGLGVAGAPGALGSMGAPAAGVGASGGAMAPAAIGGRPAVIAGAPAAMPGQGAFPPVSVPKASWTRCGSFECASLDVPLDYAAPQGRTIRLALKRRPASGARIGSLLINPGGPGASAIEFLDSFAGNARNPLRDRFDIVAFDPRGVGASVPLDCHSTLQNLVAVDPSPDDAAEWTAVDAAAQVFARECQDRHADLLPYLSTYEAVRDMDLVRQALGEDTLNYLGFSYGTELGARYADIFPERVGRFVLDGALDLKLSALEIALQQAAGFEQALSTYFAWCATAAGNCTWSGNSSPATAYAQLSQRIDAAPLVAARADRRLGPGEFLLGVVASMYSGVSGYRNLSSGLSAAVGGDGSALVTTADRYLRRRQDGSYSNLMEANNAVNCLDLPVPSSDALQAESARFAQASSNFGLSTLTGLFVCTHWGARGMQLPPPQAAGAAPILVIGTTGDPATPYAWAQALASDLESGILLTYEGEGHTAYGRGVPCIDSAVEAYLTTGKAPADGTRCAQAQAQSSIIMTGAMNKQP